MPPEKSSRWSFRLENPRHSANLAVVQVKGATADNLDCIGPESDQTATGRTAGGVHPWGGEPSVMEKLSHDHGQTSVTTPRGGSPGPTPTSLSIVRQFSTWRATTRRPNAPTSSRPEDQVTRQVILLEDGSTVDLTRE